MAAKAAIYIDCALRESVNLIEKGQVEILQYRQLFCIAIEKTVV